MTAATAQLLALPAHMAPWAENNRSLLQKLENLLLEKKDQLHEENLWSVIAEASSPDWVKARKALERSDNSLKNALNDDNVPLGSIGYALDGGETIRLMNQHSEALAHFAMVEENLRNQPETKELMNAATKALRIIAESEHSSRLADIANSKFSKVLKPMEQKPRASLSSSFENTGPQLLGGILPFDFIQGGLRNLLNLCRAPEPGMTPEMKPEVKVPEANVPTPARHVLNPAMKFTR